MSVSRTEFEELKKTIEDMQAQIAGYQRFMAIDSLLTRLLRVKGNSTLTGDLSVTGDTDLTGALDLTGDFTLAGNQIITGASRVIRGDGSNFPDLGSTTDAEKWGHIYQASARDIYPDNEENASAGIWARFVNRWGLANVTTHCQEGSGIPTGLTAFQTAPSVRYVAQDGAYTGFLRGTYYKMYPSNVAPTRSFLAATDTQPITATKWMIARMLSTGSMYIGLGADNYDSGRSYAVNERFYYYEILVYGPIPRTQVLYNHGYWVWDGAVWGGNVNTAGTAVTVHPLNEAVVLGLYINYGANSNTVAGYVIGESGGYGAYGAVVMDVDGGGTPFGARRAGPVVQTRGYAGSCFDLMYKGW